MVGFKLTFEMMYIYNMICLNHQAASSYLRQLGFHEVGWAWLGYVGFLLNQGDLDLNPNHQSTCLGTALI